MVIRRNFPVVGPTMTAPTHVISEILAVWFWTVTSIACQVIYPNELETKPIVYENKKKTVTEKNFSNWVRSFDGASSGAADWLTRLISVLVCDWLKRRGNLGR